MDAMLFLSLVSVYAAGSDTLRSSRPQVLSGGLCQYGWTQDCCLGWMRNPQGRCRPMCESGCKHGECVGPDQCRCHPGFTGKTCNQDVNECALRPCKFRCMNTLGSYKCYCLNGFMMAADGTCRNARTCAMANCQYGCAVMKGEVRCQCPSPGLSLAPDGRTCVDVDECVTGQAKCARSRKCVNTFGSFVCRCHEGFELKHFAGKYHCTDKKISSLCHDKPGHKKCRCAPSANGKGYDCKSVVKVTIEPARPVQVTASPTSTYTATTPMTTTTTVIPTPATAVPTSEADTNVTPTTVAMTTTESTTTTALTTTSPTTTPTTTRPVITTTTANTTPPMSSTAPPTTPPTSSTAPPMTPPMSSTAPPMSSTTPPMSSTAPPTSSTAPPTTPPMSSTTPPLSSTAPPTTTPISSTAPPITPPMSSTTTLDNRVHRESTAKPRGDVHIPRYENSLFDWDFDVELGNTAEYVREDPAAGVVTCSFDEGLCFWMKDSEGDLPWELTDDPAGGRYLSVPEATDRRSVKGARLTVPLATPTKAWQGGDLCLGFRHRLHGHHIGSLQVFVRKGRSHSPSIWTRTGGNGWRHTHITVGGRGLVDIVLKAERRRGKHGEITVDEFSLRRGACSDRERTE